MQDTSPGAGADCLQEERASVLLLKELFFPLSKNFFLAFSLFSPVLWMCYSQVRSMESSKHSYRLSPYFWKQWQPLEDAFCLRLRGTKSKLQVCYVLPLLSLLTTDADRKCSHECMLDLKLNKERRRKKIQAEKILRDCLSYENFKGQVPFLCSFVYFSCVVFFFLMFIWGLFPFWRVKEQERKVTENNQTMKNTRSWENSLEEQGKQGFEI